MRCRRCGENATGAAPEGCGARVRFCADASAAAAARAGAVAVGGGQRAIARAIAAAIFADSSEAVDRFRNVRMLQR
jgi:hypothetical protein